MASLPTGKIDALGPGVPAELRPLIAAIHDELASVEVAQKEPLLTLARKSLPKAVRALSEVMVRNADKKNASQIADFVTDSQLYADANVSPAWLATVTTDMQFLNKLVAEVYASAPPTRVQALGGFNAIMNPLSAAALRIKSALASATGAILDRAGDYASTKILAWNRKPLNGIIGRFFGDVFVYLDTRGDHTSPGKIPERLLAAIDQTIAEGAAGEPLVVVGHSLGGVIAFDLFSHFRPDLTVDLFVSVGSQISHFEEIKRFKTSDPTIPSAEHPLARTPANIIKWINIFDEVDIFAYACDKVFDRVDDYRYDTQTYTVKAHGAYFEQNHFYRRLRERIEDNHESRLAKRSARIVTNQPRLHAFVMGVSDYPHLLDGSGPGT